MFRTTTGAALFLIGVGIGAAVGASGLLRAAEPVSLAADDKHRAEPNWPKDFTNANNNAYLADLRQLQGELDRFKGDRHWRDSLQQAVGTQYSYVGRYPKALESFDERAGGSPSDQSASLAGYEPRDAIETILKLADRRQVVMVNEAHHVPLHRAFTIQLLEGLYQKGFRYFAAEGLTVKDEDLEARGYPTLKTGYLLHEPLYADLVRIAMQLGYQIVPYEFEGAKPRQDDDPIARQNAREEGEAKNLEDRILSKDPQAKILVHAGYGHIGKKPSTVEINGKEGEVRFMAAAFQKLTGIEPLSIDQTLMSERSKPEYEHDLYRLAIRKGMVKDKAIVLREAAEAGFLAADADCDLVVFHPRSRYENGRPTWLALGGRRQAHSVQGKVRPAEGASYLAQAFYAQEQGPEAVPIDQTEYGSDEPVPTLWLPVGEFRIRIIDESGETLHEYSTTRESS